MTELSFSTQNWSCARNWIIRVCPVRSTVWGPDMRPTLGVMSPKLLVISTTYKTRGALVNPCKKRQGIVIGQLKDSRRISPVLLVPQFAVLP
jgi:hypothetical protein